MSCTASASATPSATANTAVAVRQGWWRNSGQETVASRRSMRAAYGDGGGARRRARPVVQYRFFVTPPL